MVFSEVERINPPQKSIRLLGTQIQVRRLKKGNEMKGLIVLAHGSRASASNDEVSALTVKLSSAGLDYSGVWPSFLELADPTFAAAVDEAVASGCTALTVLPYFLNRGRHVTRDVPALIEAAQGNHPGVPIAVLTHIGGSGEFFEAVLKSIR
jgi:sirohydrochlorin ferrochelatase